MAIPNHTTFILEKAQKTKREIEGKTNKLVRREIYAGGQKVGAIEIPGATANNGWLRGEDDSLILRWEQPKRTAVEYFFYGQNNEPKGSFKMTSSRISQTREFEFRDATNSLFMQFEGKASKMTKEGNAGIFKDIQGNVIGRTWRNYKDPASGIKGPIVEAKAFQEHILGFVLCMASLNNYRPAKY